MRLLVTGFPKFDSFPENATQTLIESMTMDPPQEISNLDHRIFFEIVRFDNDDATQQRTMLASLDAVLGRRKPDVCLFCGQAAGRPRIELEMLAINVFKGRVIDPSGPPAYWATFPEPAILIESLREAEIPAALSYHAGTHLCNHTLYAAVRRAQQTASGMRCGFLHLPMTNTQVIAASENRPFIPLSITRRALTLAIQHVFEHSA